MDFNQIVEANKLINTMGISRTDRKTGRVTTKDYAEVNQRIKAFRFLYPEGSIVTELISDDGEICKFRAVVMNDAGKVLGTGTAFESKGSSFINETSYIENCETSAVGRALAMCGIGVDTSIASYEEVANAMKNQNKEDNMQPLPTQKTTTKTKTAAPKIEEPEEKKVEEAQGYPEREEMLKLAKDKYPEGSKPLQQLLQLWKVNTLDEASTAQLMVIWDKYGKK